MGDGEDMGFKVRKYWWPTNEEIRNLIIAIIVVSFVFSFDQWGVGDQTDISVGLINWFGAILIVTAAIIVHHGAQRLAALRTGLRPEFKLWGLGLVVSLIAAFMTNGFLWLVLPGGLMVHHMAAHRIGWFRYGINMWALQMNALAGTSASMFYALALKGINSFLNNPFIESMIVFSVAYALYSLIPIPPLDGSRMFYSRLLYAFSIATFLSMAALIFSPLPIVLVLIASLLVGAVGYVLYYIFIEEKIYKG